MIDFHMILASCRSSCKSYICWFWPNCRTILPYMYDLWVMIDVNFVFTVCFVEQIFPHFPRQIGSQLGSVWIDLFQLINWHKYLWDCLGVPSKFVISMFSFEVNWVIKVLWFCDIFENLFLGLSMIEEVDLFLLETFQMLSAKP